MKFVNALLLAAVAFVGIKAKCVEEANEEFFLLPVTSKAKAEERCIDNGGKLAEINDKNQNNAASAVAACTEAEAGSVDVWIKSWNGDSYNNVGILMNVNKENKGFTIHQYFESFSKRRRDEIFEIVEDAPAEEADPTATAVDEPIETPAPVEEPVEEPAPAEPVEPVDVPAPEPAPAEPAEPVDVPAPEPAPVEEPEEEPVPEPVFVDDGVGTKYEVLCQVA